MNHDEALVFAELHHAGQKDKSGRPYVEHLVRVSRNAGMIAQAEGLSPSDVEAARIIGLLHDVIEDTSVTEVDLLETGFDPQIVSAVKRLTRDNREEAKTYAQWISDIAQSGDRLSIIVKLADNRDNADPERVNRLPENERGILKRYEAAYAVLSTALEQMRSDSALTPTEHSVSP